MLTSKEKYFSQKLTNKTFYNTVLNTNISDSVIIKQFNIVSNNIKVDYLIIKIMCKYLLNITHNKTILTENIINNQQDLIIKKELSIDNKADDFINTFGAEIIEKKRFNVFYGTRNKKLLTYFSESGLQESLNIDFLSFYKQINNFDINN